MTRPLTKDGITRRLYAAVRTEDMEKPFVQELVKLASLEARKLQQQ